MLGAVGSAFSALGSINWGALSGRGNAQPASAQYAQGTQFIGNAGYVSSYSPNNAYNPGGNAAVPWAMGA